MHNFLGFFHTAYAVSLCVERAGEAVTGSKMPVSGDSEAVWDKLEGVGTKHPDSGWYHLAGKLSFTERTGPQAVDSKTPEYLAASLDKTLPVHGLSEMVISEDNIPLAELQIGGNDKASALVAV